MAIDEKAVSFTFGPDVVGLVCTDPAIITDVRTDEKGTWFYIDKKPAILIKLEAPFTEDASKE